MTQNQIKIQYLVKRYRYRHQGDKKAIDALERILWRSYPIVYDYDSLKAITKAIERRKNKKKRTNKYLAEMAVCYDALHFVTLTWRDDALATLSEATRHRYARDYLNANTRDYYANQDFGKQNEREHYHAVVALPREGRKAMAKWPYGFMQVKRIDKPGSAKTRCKISTYLLKLANHAGKATTGKSFHKRGMKEIDNLPF